MKKRSIKVFGDPSDYSAGFRERIEAELGWTRSERDLLQVRPEDAVLLRPVSPLVFALSLGRLKSRVPAAMASPQARPWSLEFQALLRFSERGIRLR